MTQELTLMSAMLQKMDWLEERQKVLAQNIANADTPGYRPMDVKEPDFKSILQSTTSASSLKTAAPGAPMVVTDPKHIVTETASQLQQADVPPPTRQKNPYEVAPAGNAVSLEEQLIKMNENYSNHAFISNLYQKNMDMLKDSLK
jgi:flagellar basal-body rod protein FlgB